MVCKWQVEIDPFCQKVLAKHWPNVRKHDDVKTFPPSDPKEWAVDVICGGFPCQDISYAGKGAGLAGERSGLFYEAVRIIREVGPRIVVLENVSARLLEGWTRYSERWTRSGLMLNGIAYRLPTLARRISGTGYLFWPTPRANDAEKRGNIANDPRNGLPAAARYLPTARAQMARRKVMKRTRSDRNINCNLEEIVADLDEGIAPGLLNPVWVEWLMGFPINHTDLEDSATQ